MIIMLAPTSPISHASVVLSDGCSVGPALCRRLKAIGGESEVRPSPVLGNWDGLTDVSVRKAADIEICLMRIEANTWYYLQYSTGTIYSTVYCCSYNSSSSVVSISNERMYEYVQY